MAGSWLEGELLWVSAKAFLIALVLTPILRDISRIYNIVDRPSLRKVHAHPIPRIGGIPIAIAYSLSLVSFATSGGTLGVPTWKLLPGAALVFLTGLLDDFIDLRPAYKLAGQTAAALVVFWGGLRVDNLAQNPLPLWLNLPLTVFWLLLATNALNLIDGLDGLCAGIGLVATMTLFGAAMMRDNIPLAHATLPLAGALLGFLCYNVNPATVFLGDSGAMLIGFLLGCYGMIWTQKTATLLSLVVPLLALSVPLLDVSLAILRRFLRNQSVFKADRRHIHHRLLEQGMTPRKAVMVLYLFAAAVAAVAILLSTPLVKSYQNFVMLAILGIVLLAVRRLRYQEFQLAGRMLLAGEFQRRLRDRLRLEKLADQLQEARNADDWWALLAEFASESSWVRCVWFGGPGEMQEWVASSKPPFWTFSIPLGDAGTIRIEGPGSPEDGAIDLPSLAQVLRSSVANRRTSWERLAAQ
jgi:UDP-GlcNAc:undecaprenyl-phosphate/decaprenyl-phosphate GlcNAc-1-phosphate transferase